MNLTNKSGTSRDESDLFLPADSMSMMCNDAKNTVQEVVGSNYRNKKVEDLAHH